MIKLLGGANQAEAALLDQVLEAQAPVHVLLGDGHHQAQVGLHHLFLGPTSEHQAPTEADQGHLHQSRPFLVVGFPAVVALELSGELFKVEQVGDFPSQLNLLIGPEQADTADFLEIHPNGVFGVDTLRADLDAGQRLGLRCLLSGNGFGFLLWRQHDLRLGHHSLGWCRISRSAGLAAGFLGGGFLGSRFLG